MSGKDYDALIIGGGINGAAIAHDAALRGLKVALVEKKDFGSGTTSASSKLAHGGLRYLKNLEFGLIRESLKERRILEKIAPHLVYPYPFIIPLYKKGHMKKNVIRMGMILYDWLSYDKSQVDYEEQKIPSHKMLSAEEVVNQEPKLLKDNILGGVKYYDCQISSPERLCLEFILTAVSNGADVSNYAELEEVIIQDNKIEGAMVTDKVSGKSFKIKSNIIVNASGPWLDNVIQLYDQSHKPILKGTKGIHIVTPKISNNAIVLTTEKKGRVFFIESWKGHSLIGTTDVYNTEDLDNVHAGEKDVLGLIEDVNEVYGVNLSLNDVKYTYAGVRPLVGGDGKETELSRKYEIKEERINGLVTIIGGKITTARKLAEQTVDIISKKLGKKKLVCHTHETPLYGSTKGHANYIAQEIKKDVDKTLVRHLIETYGSKYEEVLKYTVVPKLNNKIIFNHPDIKAQVSYALEKEMAVTLEDFMIRRTCLSVLENLYNTELLKVADIMSKYHGWDEDRKIQEIASLKKAIKVKKW